jgi:hypothetical protein
MAILYFCPTYTEDAVCLRHAKKGGECCMLVVVTFSDQGHNRVGDHGGHVRKPIPGLIGLNVKHWNSHEGWGNKGQSCGRTFFGGKAILKTVTNFAFDQIFLLWKTHFWWEIPLVVGHFSVFHTKFMLKRSKRRSIRQETDIKQGMKSTHKQVQTDLNMTGSKGCQRSGQKEWE